jgi:hypothetical protein
MPKVETVIEAYDESIFVVAGRVATLARDGKSNILKLTEVSMGMEV